MREAILDVGSNTAHLLVVDAHRGAAPLPAAAKKEELRLAEHLSDDGALSEAGVKGLIAFIRDALLEAEDQGCESVTAFATSAIREASNSDEVLALLRDQTGVSLTVLSGEDEARLTFLAVRRWFGWSAGRLLALDIGGGSLEIACGIDEEPDLAVSLPLGAGRLSRERLKGDPPAKQVVAALREYVDRELAPVASQLAALGTPERVAGTSKTFRSLARLTGAAPSSAGLRARRVLTIAGLRQVIGFISRITSADLAELEGVSPARAHQLLAGAVVAEAAMRALELPQIEICPWALREGVILRRLDWLDGA
jgi:exopolyphosphatase / guanosine-5'-triphosphate,3'-diphosphate pyrophosphatase